MHFTIIHDNGTRSVFFHLYDRLLRQQGVDLGKAPRTLEPGTNRGFVYAWDNREKAEAFARELRKRSKDAGWRVVAVEGPMSEGPLGPLLVEVAFRSDEVSFSLHPLSLALLRSAFPRALGPSSIVFNAPTWEEFQKNRGDLSALGERMALGLTDLTPEQLHAVGYVLVDSDKQKEFVTVAPRPAKAG